MSIHKYEACNAWWATEGPFEKRVSFLKHIFPYRETVSFYYRHDDDYQLPLVENIFPRLMVIFFRHLRHFQTPLPAFFRLSSVLSSR